MVKETKDRGVWQTLQSSNVELCVHNQGIRGGLWCSEWVLYGNLEKSVKKPKSFLEK